jgi:hypothetical protein
VRDPVDEERSSELTMSEDVLRGLPGERMIRRGLADARAGTWTREALVVSVAPTRLRLLGLELPEALPRDPELALYARLQQDGEDDPYARYNALLRELDSFLEALESRRRRQGAA